MRNVAVLFVCTGNICRSPTADLQLMERICAPQYRARLKLFLDFAGLRDADVPDPYCGREEGFEQVLDMVEAASRGLLDHLRGHLLCVST